MSWRVRTCPKQPPPLSLQLTCSLLLLTLLSAPRAVGGPTGRVCPLYEPPAPGIHCLHSDDVLQTITQSKWLWMLELYSSWCGHCQNFAPKYKELAKEMEAWSEFVRIGVLECSNSENQGMCSKFGVGGFPTVRMFQPNLPKPLDYKSVQVGARTQQFLRHWMVDEIASVSPRPPDWPVLDTWLTSDEVLKEDGRSWTPSVFVFEETDSYLGKELILDLWHVKSIRVSRVPDTNTALILHYSILEFPSAVVELSKGLFHVIPGHSVEDPRSEFKSKILNYLHMAGDKLSPGSQTKMSSFSQPALAPHKAASLQPQLRVDLADVLGAISYALRAEVPLQTIISGSAYLSLYNFIVLLEQAFSKVSPVGVSDSLGAIRQKLDGRTPTGFITNKEWYRVLDKLEPSLFPTEVKWKACNGSLPHFRGYPCGLWTLMHTVSLLTLPVALPSKASLPSGNSAPINSARALPVLSSFVQHFFSCEVCRAHFSEMANTLFQSSISESGEAVLWLWEAHNNVNARLLREGGGDPAHPKVLFPSISHCPYCYTQSGASVAVSSQGTPRPPDFDNTVFASGESLLEVGGGAMMQATPGEPRHVLRARQLKADMGAGQYVWNRTAVLLYLWNFYHLDMQRQGPVGIRPRVPAYLIVQAAWPGRYGVGQDQFYQRYLASRLEKEDFDPRPYLLWLGLCLLCVALVAFWLQRRRRYRRFRW